MQGTIASVGNLVGSMAGVQNLDGSLQGTGNLVGEYDKASVAPVPTYTGAYEATPTASQQVFATQNKKMADDFTVNATPFSSVINESGGNTVTIL